MSHRALAAAALATALASTAAAQSRRYPPTPVDKDAEAEARSELWESVLSPELRPYNDLVREAEQLLGHGTREDTKLALDKLGEAIAKMPDEPAAYLTRGRIHLTQRTWAACADDLGAAEVHAKDPDPITRTRNRIDLAVCQARAGRLSDAEGTLVRASANAPAYRGELGLRLGETRIALGKLDEAIDALTTALDSTDVQHHLTRWLLVGAYDRARRPGDAAEQGELAKRMDPQRTYIDAPPVPLIGVGETQYLDGVAFLHATPKPEYALLYFRQFVKLAPESPWRRRADEHIRELTSLRLPAKDTMAIGGASSTKIEDVRAALEPTMKTMRTCVTALPTTAFQITVTKVGPRTPDTARDRPLYRVPTAGVKIAPVLSVGDPPAPDAVDTASACLDKLVARTKLPVPKERDTYYTASFVVVAP